MNMEMFGYEGVGEVVATVLHTDEVKRGDIVCVVGDALTCIAGDGDRFSGVAMSNGAGLGSMLVKGFVTVSFSGSMNAGWRNLVANGNGGVREGNEGTDALVFYVNSENRTATILL